MVRKRKPEMHPNIINFAWGCFKIESFAESGKFGGCLEIYKGIMLSTSPKV